MLSIWLTNIALVYEPKWGRAKRVSISPPPSPQLAGSQFKQRRRCTVLPIPPRCRGISSMYFSCMVACCLWQAVYVGQAGCVFVDSSCLLYCFIFSSPRHMHIYFYSREALGLDQIQGVTKRCRPSWLTNSALVYEPKCGGRGELRGISQWVQLYTGAQINFDLTPYLTYEQIAWTFLHQ